MRGIGAWPLPTIYASQVRGRLVPVSMPMVISGSGDTMTLAPRPPHRSQTSRAKAARSPEISKSGPKYWINWSHDAYQMWEQATSCARQWSQTRQPSSFMSRSVAMRTLWEQN